MHNKIIILLILFIPAIISAQNLKQQIDDLKNGVLLVRLKTQENVIQGLKEKGLYERAKQVEEERRKENLEIGAAFEKEWDLCPVYFFYSFCSRQIKERDFDGCLLNSQLEPTDPLDLIDRFFIAEFWYVEPEDYASWNFNSMQYDTAGYRTMQPTYSGDTELGPDALIIRDEYFVQLKNPFPYYVRTYQGFPLLRRSKLKTVAKLQEKINKQYQRFSR